MTIELVSNTHRALHRYAQSLSKHEITSFDIQWLIHDMTEIMRKNSRAGLAAPQVGESIQLIVAEDKIEYFKTQSTERLTLIGRAPFERLVICNPVVEIMDPTPLAYFEECSNHKGILGAVIRARGIRVKYLDEHAREVVLDAKNWKARILQHKIFTHLKGRTFTDDFLPGSEMTIEEYFMSWKDAPSDEIMRHFGINSFKRCVA